MISVEETEQILRMVLFSGYFVKIKVKGSSMKPVIYDDDDIIVRKFSENLAQCGQIVLFRSTTNTLIAHRIIKIVKSDNCVKYLLKGDSTSRIDWIEKSFIIGEVFGKFFCEKIIRFDNPIYKSFGALQVKNDILSRVGRRIVNIFLCKQ